MVSAKSKPVEASTLERFGDFSMRNLKRPEAVAIKHASDSEEDLDELPFMPKKKVIK